MLQNSPGLLASGHASAPALVAPPARCGSPARAAVARRSAVKRGLGMPHRMREGSASEVSWGEGLGTGGFGTLRGRRSACFPCLLVGAGRAVALRAAVADDFSTDGRGGARQGLRNRAHGATRDKSAGYFLTLWQCQRQPGAAP
jgi:hypothetical protein